MNKDNSLEKAKSPWGWIPSLYFAEGIPLILISAVSVVMYKRMGISNTDIALFTSWLYLPWVLKGLWSPFIDMFRTRRFWIIITQFLMGAGFASIAFVIPMPYFFQLTFALFWLLAFNSATHDIAADGFYILALDEHKQVWFVWLRNTFYRLAILAGQGGLVMLAGYVESSTGLDDLQVTVKATHQKSVISENITPEKLPKITPLEGKLRVVSYPENLEIELKSLKNEDFLKVLDVASKWNTPSDIGGLQKGVKVSSFSDEYIVGPFKKYFLNYIYNFLKSNFQDPYKNKNLGEKSAGNYGTLFIHLSKPPGDDPVTVHFGRTSGNKDISLVKGQRIVFDNSNWNRPMMAVVQLDSKLKGNAETVFTARSGNVGFSWLVAFIAIAVLYTGLAIYHLIMLPKPDNDGTHEVHKDSVFSGYINPFKSFFTQKSIVSALAFLLFYRLGESQLLKIASPFLLDYQENGGLALTTEKQGFVYGTVGVFMLVIGGVVGAVLAAKHGLKKWIWWMAVAINVPNLVYVYMANTLPDSFVVVNICVAIEQFGYGLGFTGYMLFMVYFAEESEYKTSHYAIMTGFMALGMMLPGMISGWIQEIIGYYNFFIWVMISTIPSFISIAFIKIDPEFGKKKVTES